MDLSTAKPTSFKIGHIYKMEVASRSHVKTPYYVEITDTGKSFIQTYIPDHHALKISYGSPEWDYHIPRMTFMGTVETHNDLLYNQGNLIPEGHFKQRT